MPTSVMPSARARSSASEVGAEIATTARAPNAPAFSIISNEQRLVMTMNPLPGSTLDRRSAPISLSRALCRPTSSRSAISRPSSSANAAAWTARRVRAPHHAGRVGGDASVVVVDWPLRAAVRREQSILAHEAQHPVPADADAIEGAQAGPDLAVPLAGEGRAIEVAADRLEQPRI